MIFTHGRTSKENQVGGPAYRRGAGQTRISAKHQVTIPMSAFTDAGFKPGDAVRAEAIGPGRVVAQGIRAGLRAALHRSGRVAERTRGGSSAPHSERAASAGERCGTLMPMPPFVSWRQ
jgi:bifunctional DNA-binding transcriptional regulator/antitoxin component of YhaV-PrlF toxin-antitoxin module